MLLYKALYMMTKNEKESPAFTCTSCVMVELDVRFTDVKDLGYVVMTVSYKLPELVQNCTLQGLAPPVPSIVVDEHWIKYKPPPAGVVGGEVMVNTVPPGGVGFVVNPTDPLPYEDEDTVDVKLHVINSKSTTLYELLTKDAASKAGDGPVAPVAPATEGPFGPAGPVAPSETPAAPVGPTGPVGPVGPCSSPAGPVGPA